MNNFDKLHQEQDEFIKQTFQEDKVVSQPVLNDFTNYIEHSNIKVKKYTYKQKKLIIILFILLILSVGFNLYLTFKPEDFGNINLSLSNKKQTVTENKVLNNTISDTQSKTENKQENKIVEENDKYNTAVITSKPENTIENTVSQNSLISGSSIDTTGIDKQELKELIEDYSYAIERVSYSEDSLESNTILLVIAKKYFDTNSAKDSSLNINTKYAQTTKNVHTYLNELTGKDFSSVNYIPSYNNYVGYAQSNKAYVPGKDYPVISKEKYECTDLKFTENNNGNYTAETVIIRTVDKVETNYKVTFTFKVNEDYTYQKYCITSLKSKNTSFYPDNTLHFVDVTNVEEDEN